MTITRHPVRIDADHIYWVPQGSGENRVPGYSEICASMRVGEEDCEDCLKRVKHIHQASFWTPEGREEGIALSKWLHFLAQGKTSSTAPDPRIAGRVEGIKKFVRDSGFVFLGGEEPLFDPTNVFACMPDIWGRIGPRNVVIDGKRGGKLKSHKLQTAAQKIALAANGFRVDDRYSLYLKEADYRLDKHDDPGDENRWRAVVSGFHAKGHYF